MTPPSSRARVVSVGTTDRRPAAGSGRGHASERRLLLGVFTVTASLLYFVSDLIEAHQGGFSDAQLWLTLLAEASIPVFVIGLAVAQRPRLGRLGDVAGVAYAYSYVVFTGAVVYVIVDGTRDYATLTEELGLVMTTHGAVMVVAGLGFGYAVLRARTFPAWTAVALMAGVDFAADAPWAQRSRS